MTNAEPSTGGHHALDRRVDVPTSTVTMPLEVGVLATATLLQLVCVNQLQTRMSFDNSDST